jgi:glucose-6-phosphate-specific signal transduction histidine kinase
VQVLAYLERVEAWTSGTLLPLPFGGEAVKMGVGLRGMRERVQQLDGKFELQSGSRGTKVKATLPIRVTAA